MCGIAGIIDYKGKTDSRFIINKMLSAISYRGPDESGLYHSPYATIGSVRLSIIDIEGGHQPLSDPSGRYWIVFNGEIFNYTELRSDLEKKGCSFRTKSDTEVLIQLYATYKEKCVNLLNGQFAFAVWDKLTEELFIARDRVGIRPLFYNNTDGIFSFSSEIKALFEHKLIIPEFNHEGLIQIYTLWTAVTPGTAFKNIFELSPGHYAIINRNGLKMKKYWNLNFDSLNSSVSLPDAIEGFDELFSDSVRLRLRADVEVAAYLSGGIDSSATVAYIKKIEPGVLNTFSIGFENKAFDESNYQNLAVNYFKTKHQSLVCTSKDIADFFPQVIWHAETPLTRTAPTPMLLLSKFVRENNIKVVITGEGSDEILAGYDIFRESEIRRFWASQPNSVLRPLMLKNLYSYIPNIEKSNITSLKLFFGYKLEDTDNPFYSHLLRWNNSNYIKKHFSDTLLSQLKTSSLYGTLTNILPDNFDSWDSLSKSQWIETTFLLTGYLLSSQGDRMSMANSVEGRYPFLDYRLIEYCSTLPPRYKLNGLTEKFLLKRLLRNKIPDEIIKRTKQPYRSPVREVFLSDDSPDYVNQMLSEKSINKVGVFNYKSLSDVISRIRKTGISSEMDDMLITSVISTQLLHFQFIENNNKEFQQRILINPKVIEDFE